GPLQACRPDHPRIRFARARSYGGAMLERLRAGALDLCLSSRGPAAPDLVARRMDAQKLRLVVPADHRLAGRRRVRLAEAADDTFVTLEPGYGHEGVVGGLREQIGRAHV